MAVIGQEAGFPGCCTPGGDQERRREVKRVEGVFAEATGESREEKDHAGFERRAVSASE
jgi:hypothetical protein